MTDIRVLSYNIRSMRDSRSALVRVIRGCEPDVVCLQEVPRFLFWRVKRRWLAWRCGLRVAAGRRAGGLAVLARPGIRVLHREYHLLSKVPKLHRRALALAVLEIDGGDGRRGRLVAASTHLDLAGEPRLVHAREVLELLTRVSEAYDAPVMLTGDINEEPGGAAWALFAQTYRDARAEAPRGLDHTFSAREPRRRIDGVFADTRIEIAGCGVPESPALSADYPKATDHRPLLAEVRLPVPGSTA